MRVAGVCGAVQRGGALGVGRADRGVGVEQHAHALEVLVERRLVQRRGAGGVDRIDVGASSLYSGARRRVG